MKTKKPKSHEELKKKLTPDEYRVTQLCGTELPFSGALLHVKDSGKYACKVCGSVLFDSQTKFDSGTGWPSFNEVVKGAVKLKNDYSLIIPRVEVVCATCESHLGHLFNDGPQPTGKRYCINSVALDFKKTKTKK